MILISVITAVVCGGLGFVAGKKLHKKELPALPPPAEKPIEQELMSLFSRIKQKKHQVGLDREDTRLIIMYMRPLVHIAEALRRGEKV